MKNIIIGVILAVTAISASAAKVEDSTEAEIASTGIITPKIAVGVIHTTRIAYTSSGEIVVCPSVYDGRRVQYLWSNEECTDPKTRENRWVYPKDLIPKGKTYVGFKSYVQNGSHVIDIFWK